MVSDKFKKRFKKLHKENKNDDFRITKRYIDETDTVYGLAGYIGQYVDDAIDDAENVDINDNINNYKSIAIEFEVTKTDVYYPYKLVFIVDYDIHNNVMTRFKENKALKKLNEDNHLLTDIGYKNEVTYKTVVKAVNVLKTRWYQKMRWEDGYYNSYII